MIIPKLSGAVGEIRAWYARKGLQWPPRTIVFAAHPAEQRHIERDVNMTLMPTTGRTRDGRGIRLRTVAGVPVIYNAEYSQGAFYLIADGVLYDTILVAEDKPDA